MLCSFFQCMLGWEATSLKIKYGRNRHPNTKMSHILDVLFTKGSLLYVVNQQQSSTFLIKSLR